MSLTSSMSSKIWSSQAAQAGLLAPAGTPREIIMRVHGAVIQALNDPEIKGRFIEGGAEPTPSASPEEFGALLRAELKKWSRVVKNAGIKPE